MTEPYIEKVYKYLASRQLCVIVIDNVDLYEDDALETNVFSEAISISKTIRCNTIVSIRDTTFIKHKNTSIFNAYELKKFWVNPPSFKEVLSKRLNYAKKILKDKTAELVLNNGAKVKIDDLSLFFQIVQKSVLNENNSKLLEYLSDRNPRRGIALIQNFLTSGHIQADKAINNYITGDAQYTFPFHEIFKGCLLGQWKYFKENRSDVYNIFDSNLGSRTFQLLRFYILKSLFDKAKIGTPEVNIEDIKITISYFGGSDEIANKVIKSLLENSLIHSNDEHTVNPNYYITLCGGYYISNLSKSIVYVETVMYDTNIFDSEIFDQLCHITIEIEDSRDIVYRMKIRKRRIKIFIDYLYSMESEIIKISELKNLSYIKMIEDNLLKEFDKAIERLYHRYGGHASNRPTSESK